MTSIHRSAILTRLAYCVIGGAAVVATLHFATQGDLLSTARSARPRADEPQHDGDEHTRFEAALRTAMNGPVDVYMDTVQIESKKPLLAEAKFDGLVDVTGKHLLRFSDNGGQKWLIDPDTVLAFRIHEKRISGVKKRR